MIEVVKRDGRREPLDIEKLHKVVTFACEDIAGVSASEVEIHSQIQFFSGIKSADVQETLIKSAADLISEETPNYQKLRAHWKRLLTKELYLWNNSYENLPSIDLVFFQWRYTIFDSTSDKYILC